MFFCSRYLFRIKAAQNRQAAPIYNPRSSGQSRRTYLSALVMAKASISKHRLFSDTVTSDFYELYLKAG